jgi:hypothetical protein
VRQGSCAMVDWSRRLRYLGDDLRWSILESPWEEAEAVHRKRERGGEKAQAKKDPRGEGSGMEVNGGGRRPRIQGHHP